MQTDILFKNRMLMPEQTKYYVRQDNYATKPVKSADEFFHIRWVIQPMWGFFFLLFWVTHLIGIFLLVDNTSKFEQRTGEEEKDKATNGGQGKGNDAGPWCFFDFAQFALGFMVSEKSGNRYRQEIKNIKQ